MATSARDRMVQGTRDAVAKLGSNRSPTEMAGRHEPEPGRLYLFEETKDLPVEWLVLGPSGAGCYRLVPADAVDLVGSSDVPIPAEARRGPLVLRCAFGLDLRRDRFADASPSGRIEEEYLEKAVALEHRLSTEGLGEVGPESRLPLDAWETDRSPEYLDWIEDILEPGRISLLEALDDPVTTTRVHEATNDQHPSPRRGWLRVAASVLLAAGLSSVLTYRWQQGTLRELEAKVASAATASDKASRSLAELRDEHRRAQDEGRDLREDLKRAQEREEELRRQVADLEAAPGALSPRPEGNLPFVLLSPVALLRGEAGPVTVDGSASFFVLILHLEEPRRFERYRLAIHEAASGVRRWRSGDLRPTGASEVTVALPGGWLPAGEYRLRLQGLAEDGPSQVHEYSLDLHYR